MFEVLGGTSRVAEAELEFAERRRCPDLISPHPELVAEAERFGGAGPALLFPPAARQQPGETCQAKRQLGLLPAFACQLDRFLVGGCGSRPPVGGGLIAGD